MARAQRKAHSVLNEVWNAAVPEVGLMASKIVDGDTLNRLTLSDIAVVNISAVFFNTTRDENKSLCAAKLDVAQG